MYFFVFGPRSSEATIGDIFTSRPSRVKSIAISVSVYLFVSLFVCPPVYQKPHVHILLNFLYMLPVAVARSCSDGNMLCTFSFVNERHVFT